MRLERETMFAWAAALLAGAGCSSPPPQAAPESSCSRIGVVDVRRFLFSSDHPPIAKLLAARDKGDKSLRPGTRELLKQERELKDQIAALSIESPLRQEKVIVLLRCRSEIEKDETWKALQTAFRLDLAPVAILRTPAGNESTGPFFAGCVYTLWRWRSDPESWPSSSSWPRTNSTPS